MKRDQTTIDTRLHELIVEVKEHRAEFQGFAQAVRREVDTLVTENKKNTAFRERMMGVIIFLGSSTVLGLFVAGLRFAFSRWLA